MHDNVSDARGYMDARNVAEGVTPRVLEKEYGVWTALYWDRVLRDEGTAGYLRRRYGVGEEDMSGRDGAPYQNPGAPGIGR